MVLFQIIFRASKYCGRCQVSGLILCHMLIPRPFLHGECDNAKGLNDKSDSLRRELNRFLPLLGDTRPQHRSMLGGQEPPSYASLAK